MERCKVSQMKGKVTKVTLKKDSRLNLDLESKDNVIKGHKQELQVRPFKNSPQRIGNLETGMPSLMVSKRTSNVSTPPNEDMLEQRLEGIIRKSAPIVTTEPASRRQKRANLTYNNDPKSLSSSLNATTYGRWIGTPVSNKSGEKVTQFETKVEFKVSQTKE